MSSTDQDQFVAELLRHQDAIYAFIKVLLPSCADADDVFQDVCLILWKKRADFESGKAFISWARGIARNEVRAFRRKNINRYSFFSNEILEQLVDSQVEAVHSSSDTYDLLAGCLAKVEQGQQDLLHRIYAGDEKVTGIAESLDTSPDALYVKLHRLRRALLECIRQGMDSEGEV